MVMPDIYGELCEELTICIFDIYSLINMRERLTKDIQGGPENFIPNFKALEVPLPPQVRAYSSWPKETEKELDNTRDEDILEKAGIGCIITFGAGAFIVYESIFVVIPLIQHPVPLNAAIKLFVSSLGF